MNRGRTKTGQQTCHLAPGTSLLSAPMAVTGDGLAEVLKAKTEAIYLLKVRWHFNTRVRVATFWWKLFYEKRCLETLLSPCGLETKLMDTAHLFKCLNLLSKNILQTFKKIISVWKYSRRRVSVSFPKFWLLKYNKATSSGYFVRTTSRQLGRWKCTSCTFRACE